LISAAFNSGQHQLICIMLISFVVLMRYVSTLLVLLLLLLQDRPSLALLFKTQEQGTHKLA